MEIVGLAVGIPGLFSVCLDIVERVEIYKSFGTHSRQLIARLDTSKLRLREWANGVGIVDGRLQDGHHPRLDVPEVASVVKAILFSVCEIFEDAEQTRARLQPPVRQQGVSHSSSLWPNLPGGPMKLANPKSMSHSKRHGLAWAVNVKNLFTGHVEMLEALVDRLYDVVPPIEDGVDLHEENLKEFASFQRDLKILMQQTRRTAVLQAYKGIDEWLDVPKIDQQYEKHIQDRLEGTCDWIFQNLAYRTWASTDYPERAAKILWVCGPAGHGKSVLCARIYQTLTTSSALPHCYFSSTGHVQAGGQPSAIIRYWLSQLIRTNQTIFNLVWDNLQSKPTTQTVSHGEAWTIFEKVVTNVDNCTFVLDGFDEYTHSEGNRKEFLGKLKKAVAGTKTRCLIGSRVEADIEVELRQDFCQPGTHIVLECRLSQEVLQPDIELYSNTIVTEQLPRKDEVLRRELASELATKCEGMFLWIRLQRDRLRSGKGQKELRSIVKSMPSGLNHSYDRNWRSIQNLSDDDRDRAVSILRWTTFAYRPLTVGELTEILIVNPDDSDAEFPTHDLPDYMDDDYVNSEIKSLCSSLIELGSAATGDLPETRTVHLIHPSVKEYLISIMPVPLSFQLSSTSNHCQDLQDAYLAKVCLCYLNLANVWNLKGPLQSEVLHRHFLEYAASHWFKHINDFVVLPKELDDMIKDFFTPGNPRFDAWEKYIEGPLFQESRFASKASANMYYASAYGLTSAMKYLYSQGYTDIDPIGCHGTALQMTCRLRNSAAFDLLMSWGADVNVYGGEFGSALNAAAAEGEEYMVKRLIDKGADLSIPGEHDLKALHWTCLNDRIKIVPLLLDEGAFLNVRDKYGRTPLFLAAMCGHLKMVNLLLDRGADLDMPTNGGWTPVKAAVFNGHHEVTKLLLDRSADPNIPNNYGWTPVHLAAYYGDLEAVRLLLGRGADVSIVNNNGSTPMRSAASNGHLEVVRLLLDRGADISIVDNNGKAAMDSAASKGHLEVVRLLLNRGAVVSVMNNHGWTMLHIAASKGHLEVVRLLLDRGVLPVPDDRGRTPLHSTAMQGHAEITHLLLERGEIVDHRDSNHSTALHYAIYQGHEPCIDLLIRHGADLFIVDIYGRTCLDWLRLLCSHLAKFREWTAEHSHVQTASDQRRHLISSVCRISQILLKGVETDSCLDFGTLGRCFLFLGMFEDASFAFQQQLTGIDDDGMVVHDVRCDVCHGHPVKGDRSICQICPDVDFCEGCAEYVSAAGVSSVCQNHTYLKISSQMLADFPSEKTKIETLQRWSRLRIDDEVDGAESELQHEACNISPRSTGEIVTRETKPTDESQSHQMRKTG